MPPPDLTRFEWSRDRMAEALNVLGAAAGWPARVRPSAVEDRDANAANGDSQAADVAELAREAELDADLIDVPATRPLVVLRRASPLILEVPGMEGVLLVVRCGRRSATLAGHQGVARVPLVVLEDLLWGHVDGAAHAPGAASGNVLDGILVGESVAARRVFAGPGLVGRPLASAWKVRMISRSLADDLRRAGLIRRFAAVIAAFVAQFALFFAIWNRVGARVLTTTPPDASGGWSSWGTVLALLGAWAVAQLLASATVSRLALDVGGVVRVWLLRGALRLDGERIRSAGVGQLLGRALDAEALDVLALGGGVQAVAGIFELAFGIVLLALGAAAGWCLAALALILIGVVVGARVHERRLITWCRTRRALTHDLVERMVGHRTVLIQDRPTRRQVADESALHAYDAETRELDRAAVWLGIGVPRAWLLLGLLVLGILGSFRFGALEGGARGSGIALSVGGIWLVYSALRRLGIALPNLSSAREAWGRIAPMVGDEASDAGERPLPNPASGEDPERLDRGALIRAHALSFQYPGRATPVLEDVTLQITPHDRILIEGASGGGKSTLVALLTGLKVSTTGRLSLRGVDQRSIGLARWRLAVGAVPQFHDNHVLGADLLFNLLMGRRWPPRIEDEVAAELVCRTLGLGPLLDRMPAGLQQQVGETGWQLSHGERSRLFVARSLLQTLDARVLDESFAALDPETLDQVMEAVLRQPEALVVIAHP